MSENLLHFDQAQCLFDTELIGRFDVNGPRYTSYPTADRFHNNFTADHLVSNLQQIADSSQAISLYVHLPFCQTICYYCGCNKIITKDHGRSAKYIQYLKRDIARQTAIIGKRKSLIQLHWGGGTPTFLSREEMDTLMNCLRENFDFLPNGEFSIEVDPRKVNADDVNNLGRLGFNRMSIGVQDFDLDVQKAVNRLQSIEETELVVKTARESGFLSISFDLIYGLPKQSVSSFSRTLDTVIAMSPDRLSVYNYAHLPTIFMPQRRIAESDLPSANERLAIMALTIERLTAAGYVFIGMDHFAKPQDELAVAQREHRLHRNFQGYSTYAECDMLSYGISAIAQVNRCYSQNVKTIDEYYELIDAKKLPVLRGIEFNDDDILRRNIIQSLMCHFSLDITKLNQKFQINFNQYFAAELKELESLSAAGLVEINVNSIKITSPGRILVRAIAMVFDYYLQNKQSTQRFSKII